MTVVLCALLGVCVALILVLARHLMNDDRPRRVRAEERPHRGWIDRES